MSRTNESCHVRTNNVTYESVMSRMNESCDIWTNSFTYESVMSHVETSIVYLRAPILATINAADHPITQIRKDIPLERDARPMTHRHSKSKLIHWWVYNRQPTQPKWTSFFFINTFIYDWGERWGAGVETQKNVRGEIWGWGRVPFNEPYAPLLSTIYNGA